MPKKKKNKKAPEVKKGTNGAGTRALETAITQLKKKHGENVINWLSNVQTTPLEIISTGCLALDNALGVGGVARGRIYEFYGPQSSGKSTLAYSIIREAVKKGLKTVFVDAEHTLDKRLVAKMGAAPEHIILVQGYTGEDNLDIAETLIATGEVAICVIDSISALQPLAEANLESFSNNTMGAHPRLMSRMCRTFTPLVSRTKTTFILINQLRANMSGYGPTETTSGGNALKHHTTAKIRVLGGTSKAKRLINEEGAVVGHRVEFEVVRNKLGPPFRTAAADLVYGEGFNRASELLDLGVDMGLIDQSGAWFSLNGEKIGQGRVKAISFISNDEAARAFLNAEVEKILGLAQ
jgi:recombination protein RecA